MDIIEILKKHFKEHMTDEISESIQTSFDLAVSEKVSVQKEKLIEEYDAELKENTETGLIELEEKLDTYINKANEELIDENLGNIESKSKVELAGKLVEGILNTLKENDMNIAIEDKDIIKQLETENAKLEESVNRSVEETTEAKKEIFEHEKAVAILNMTKNMTDTEIETISSMVEHVNVSTIDDFKEKVKTSIDLVIKESDDKSKEESLEENFSKKNSELSEFTPKWIND